jgi:hypothetical protein
MKRLLFLMFVGSMTNSRLSAQQEFQMNLWTGLNFCQIDGDQESGFNKVGYSAGVEVWRGFNDKFNWHTGVQLSQRGSRSYNDPEQPNPFPFHYVMNMVEVPCYISVATRLKHTRVLAGAQAGYLFDARDKLGSYSQLQDDLRTFSLMGSAGLQHTGKKISLRLSFQYGLNSMRKPVVLRYFVRSGVFHNNVQFAVLLPLTRS